MAGGFTRDLFPATAQINEYLAPEMDPAYAPPPMPADAPVQTLSNPNMTFGSMLNHWMQGNPASEKLGAAAMALEQGANAINPAAGVLDGTRAIYEGATSGDVPRMAGGFGQAGMGLLGASRVPGAGPAADMLFGNIGRSIGTATVGAVSPMLAEGGQAATGGFAPAVADDASELLDLRTRRKREERSLLPKTKQGLSGSKIREIQQQLGIAVDGNWGPGTAEAVAAYNQAIQDRLDALDKNISDKEYRMTPEYQDKLKREQAEKLARTPFNERFPEVAGALPYLGIGLAAGIPAGQAAAKNVSSFFKYSPTSRMNRAVQDGVRAFSGGKPGDVVAARDAINKWERHIPGTTLEKTASGTAGYGGAAFTGGVLNTEATALPHLYNAYMLPQDSKDRQESQAALMDPARYAKSFIPGAFMGMTGRKIGLSGMPKNQPDYGGAAQVRGYASDDFATDVGKVRANMGAAGQAPSGSGTGSQQGAFGRGGGGADIAVVGAQGRAAKAAMRQTLRNDIETIVAKNPNFVDGKGKIKPKLLLQEARKIHPRATMKDVQKALSGTGYVD